jgi:polysaccharide export outer membrane protein
MPCKLLELAGTHHMKAKHACVGLAALAHLMLLLPGCGGKPELASATATQRPAAAAPYRIGPGDTLRVFVWGNPGLSDEVPVRPDGRISVPLLEDVEAAGKTPTELAREIEGNLSTFVADPLVTVIVTNFVGPSTQQVRVVGEATEPQAIPYRSDMTLLDVMIAAGGLTDFAAGNRATLVRTVDGDEQEYRVRLDDLLRDGDISANVAMRPGDVVIIPETFF